MTCDNRLKSGTQVAISSLSLSFMRLEFIPVSKGKEAHSPVLSQSFLPKADICCVLTENKTEAGGLFVPGSLLALQFLGEESGKCAYHLLKFKCHCHEN